VPELATEISDELIRFARKIRIVRSSLSPYAVPMMTLTDATSP